MNAVLLGLGLQGRAALYDLSTFSDFEKISAIDINDASLEWVNKHFKADARVQTCKIDINDTNALLKKLKELKNGIVIDLLPIQFIAKIANAAIEANWHYINTYYTTPQLYELSEEAKSKGLIILPELGFDPGIDLVLAGDAIRQLDKITEYLSYGGGFPEPAACDNPLKYKITWTFVGVLNSYYRSAKIIQDGKLYEISADEIFSEENTHTVNIAELGTLEAFPNGDVTKYAKLIGSDNIKRAGRYALRWPGHCKFWHTIAKLGLLEDRDISINSETINQRYLFAKLLEPKLQYKDNERDIAALRIELAGIKNGQQKRYIYEMIDYRDLNTGLFAMNRTVGFTAAIGAQMIAQNLINSSGLLNPIKDVPYQPFVEHLAKRNIKVKTCTK